MDGTSNDVLVDWSDDLISKLIQLRFEKRDEFKISGKRGSTHDAWMNIIRDLQLEKRITVLGIRKVWNSVLNKFKDIENKIADGSCDNDVAWPHYNQMQTIMNELSCIENPSILATGISNETVKIQFSDMVPENENENEEGGASEYRSSKQTRRDIIDEKFLAAVEEGNEQLKAMNATLDRQGEAFLQLMTRLVNTLEGQVVDDGSMHVE